MWVAIVQGGSELVESPWVGHAADQPAGRDSILSCRRVVQDRHKVLPGDHAAITEFAEVLPYHVPEVRADPIDHPLNGLFELVGHLGSLHTLKDCHAFLIFDVEPSGFQRCADGSSPRSAATCRVRVVHPAGHALA
jgi:hypothetical protein